MYVQVINAKSEYQVPGGVQRETPPEGLTLPDGRFIPGETLIWMPIHTIQRDERYFTFPETFAPERWWISEEAIEGSGTQTVNRSHEQDEPHKYRVIDKRAFMPFGTGAYNCVGQKLAIMEMRSVTANLVRMFDIEFAEGETGENIVNKTKDAFTLTVGKLDVRLKPRKVGEA